MKSSKHTRQERTKLTVMIVPEAKDKLGELQVALRKKLRKKQYKDRATTPGKIVEELLLMDNAFDYLEEKFLST